MSEYFDELMMNEVIAIERDELKGRKTVYESQTVKKIMIIMRFA